MELDDSQQEPPPPPEQQFELDTQQLVVVQLSDPLPPNAGIREREMAGLALALLESSLAEVQHVLPVVQGAQPSPGLASWSVENASFWTAQVSLEESRTAETLRVELCDPSHRCNDQSVTAPLMELPQSLGPLYAGLSQQLKRNPLAGAQETWDAPLTRDSYALRVAGRAAASIYGLLPPVAPEALGDKRRDPVARAVFLDPSLSLAQWLLGRRELMEGRPVSARECFSRALLESQRRVLFRADEAAALLAEGHDTEAVRAWEALRKEAPDDVRFIPGHARALLGAGAWKQAQALLDALPARYQRSLTVLPLRAQLADHGVGTEPSDSILAEWETLSLRDPQPTLQRIQLRVREGKLAEALTLVPSLNQREGGPQAAQLGMALAVGTRDWTLAETEAKAAKLPRVAAAIHARATLEKTPAQIPPELLTASDGAALLARGGAFIAMGRFGSALVEANRLLEQSPWSPEGLALRARAQWGLGRAGDAQHTEALLRFADPDWPADREVPPYGDTLVGPSTAPGSTGLGSHRQDSPP